MTTPQWEARRATPGGWYLENPKGEMVGLVLGDDVEAEGNAKFLVLAANSYRPLVEALDALIDVALIYGVPPDVSPSLLAARAALALTREEQ